MARVRIRSARPCAVRPVSAVAGSARAVVPIIRSPRTENAGAAIFLRIPSMPGGQARADRHPDQYPAGFASGAGAHGPHVRDLGEGSRRQHGTSGQRLPGPWAMAQRLPRQRPAAVLAEDGGVLLYLDSRALDAATLAAFAREVAGDIAQGRGANEGRSRSKPHDVARASLGRVRASGITFFLGRLPGRNAVLAAARDGQLACRRIAG